MAERGAFRSMAPFLFGAAAMFATMYSTQPILPQLGRSFGIGPARAGLSISALIAAIAVGAWLWGPLSDRIGRRRSLVLASALLVAPTLAVAAVPSFSALVALRAVQGLCMPGLLTVGVPYVAEVYGERNGSRAMGFYVAALVAGGLVGRIGVSLLTAAFDWRVALATLAVFPAAAAVVMARRLPAEPPRAAGSRGSGLRLLLRNRQLVAATAAGSCLFFGFVGAFSFVEYRLEQPPFSLSPALASGIYVLWLLGAAGPATGRFAGRIGWRPVAFAGLSLSAVGLVLSMVPALPALAVGLGLFALGNFAGITATQLGVAGSTTRNRGTASALYYSSYYLAGGLGGFLPGLAWQAWSWDGVALLSVTVFGIGLMSLGVVGALRPRDLRVAARSALAPS